MIAPDVAGLSRRVRRLTTAVRLERPSIPTNDLAPPTDARCEPRRRLLQFDPSPFLCGLAPHPAQSAIMRLSVEQGHKGHSPGRRP